MFGYCCEITDPSEAVRFLQIGNNYPLEVYDSTRLGDFSFIDWWTGMVSYETHQLDTDPASHQYAYDLLQPYKVAYSGFGFINRSGGRWTVGTVEYLAGVRLGKWETQTAYPDGCWLQYDSVLYEDFIGIDLSAPDSYTDGVSGEHILPDPDAVALGDPEEVTAHVFFWDKSYAELSFPVAWSSIYWFPV